MKRYVSVRYERALDESEQDAATRALGSVGARVTSWNAIRASTFASIAFEPDADLAAFAAAVPDATVEAPGIIALRIAPRERRALADLETALAGAGGPVGIRSVCRDGDDALIVTVDANRTPLAVLVALVDATLRCAPGRTIDPLVTLGDDVLVAFAASLLGDRALDPGRLVETYLEPLLR